jgi:hypothetical protein
MDDAARQSAFMSALTAEHFVLQTAASSTINESAARSSLYVFSLSSSLVAMGFASQSPGVFMPFVAVVLPAVFLLGVFTVVRLVDTALEYMQYLAGIARVRSYYRTLAPEAMLYFSADSGRWPEAKSPPAMRLGPLVAFLGTTASMIAFINNVVAGVIVTLGINAFLGGDRVGVAVSCGVVSAVILMMVFLAYQRWRFSIIDLAVQPAEAT